MKQFIGCDARKKYSVFVSNSIRNPTHCIHRDFGSGETLDNNSLPAHQASPFS